jgi:hypothetical protein
MRSPFGPPEPTPFSVRWDRTPEEVTQALGAAVRERIYADPGRESQPFFRFDGAVSGARVAVRLTPYAVPGVIGRSHAMPLVVRGEVQPARDGAVLEGLISTAVPRSGLWLLLAGSVIWFVMIVPGEGLLPWLVLEGLFAATAAVVMPWNRRRVLRFHSEHVRKVLREVVNRPVGPGSSARPRRY